MSTATVAAMDGVRPAELLRPASQQRCNESGELNSFNSFNSFSIPISSKPLALDPAALHGLAGEVVSLFDMGTEADPVAVLASFLVAFGNACGSSPHIWVGETRHGVNLFAAIVGDTARSRKGTSWGIVRRVLEYSDTGWLETRQVDGVGSGESIIWAIRDQPEPTLNPKTGESIVTDLGVSDKRLMVQESELAQLLKVAYRSGSTLSETVRKAWDGGTLRNMTKNSPARATNAHVSILGHVTKEELLREIDGVSQVNGFANRFLWVHARRSKIIPFPQRLSDSVVCPVAQRVAKSLALAQETDEMRLDPGATELWIREYPRLTLGRPGLSGSITSRGEAHALRLGMVFALIDASPTIREDHLTAAIAFWNYCESSARFIFGNRTGNSYADRIAEALAANGAMTESQISLGVFKKNASSGKIKEALGILENCGLASCRTEKTGGRDARIWSVPGHEERMPAASSNHSGF